ncbi:MAG: DUF305 domain-containing protein [Actinomycetota bacterium]|nr:DUF305 domain-containing protein [Actinomycetota bacterium]
MNKHTRIGVLCALPLVAAISLVGCSSHESSTAANGTMNHESPTSSNTAAASADIAFAQMMIPHHEQAVEMSELAPDRASSAFIKELAGRIQNAQQPEIDLMASWLTNWGVPRMNMADSLNAHAGHGMAGVMSEADMAKLTAAKGSQFDRLYAEMMIAHHEGAIEMAMAVEQSSNPEVSTLAKQIIAAQQVEIAEMQDFLQP